MKQKESGQTLLEHLMEGIIIIKKDPIRVCFANSAVEEILGYSSDMLVTLSSKELMELIHKDDREFVLKRLYDRLEKKQVPERYEFRCYHKDGSVIWLSTSSRYIEYEGEAASLSIIINVTAKKTAEELMYKKLKKYKEISEISTDWIWEVDRNFIYTYSSPGVREILGYEPEEIIGNTPFDFMPEEDSIKCYQEFMQLIRDESTLNQYKNTCRHRDGKRVTLETNAFPTYNDKNILSGYRGINRDITGRNNHDSSIFSLVDPTLLNNTEKEIKVLIAEDHTLTAKLLKLMLVSSKIINVIGNVSNGDDLFKYLREKRVDIVLLDLIMPNFDGIQAIERIAKIFPLTKIVILSAHTEPWLIQKAMSSGASAYLTKFSEAQEVIEAILTVQKGGRYFCKTSLQAITNDFINKNGNGNGSQPSLNSNLTVREKEVLDLIAREFSTPEIARMLSISPRTAETHRKNILKKFGTRSTAGLIKVAMESGMIKM